MSRKKVIAIGLAACAVLAFAAVKTVAHLRTEQTYAALSSTFTHDALIGAYDEALPKFYGGREKAERGVLLLHGYSASPQEFDTLVGPLREAGIPYYAPLMTGFGLDDFRLLDAVEPKDWVRDALAAYDIVAGMAEHVSIVGHSNGGALAAIVAAHRPVDKLILTGPSVFVHPQDAFIKKIATTPVISDVAVALIPVFVKPHRPDRVTNTDTKDPEAAKKSFHFSALSSRSLVTVWTVQDLVDIQKSAFNELWLLHGADDETVDIPTTIAALKRMGIAFHERSFPRSGHNILEDYDRDDAIRTVMTILKK